MISEKHDIVAAAQPVYPGKLRFVSLRMCDVLYINLVLAECSGGISRDFLVFQLPYFHQLDCNTEKISSLSGWRAAEEPHNGNLTEDGIAFHFLFLLFISFPIFFWRR